ncbi:O-antigen translocase [Shewanella sp. SG41-3]|uniref:O-antigen translocase n=1 Tax=Shewanella sp. SG41-3 TaxID=2760977 RepID=UPI001600E597|nr:O-antigen translocase [Shewanella sp. SG41-3]MBB1474337.1 O-antigen translocase [Shewanella sp. SG41-3]
MNLAKTSILSFIATAIKILAGLVINKAVSIYIGPSGLAVIGQFQNALGLIQTIAKGGINSGVTKYTAEYHDDPHLRSILWSTSLKLTMYCSLAFSIFLIFGASYFSEYIFKTNDYNYVFITFGFTLTIFSVNQLLLSILNGLKEIKTFISINIIQSIYSLFFTTLLILYFELDGALFAMVTNQSVVFFIVLWKLRRHNTIIFENFNKRFNNEEFKKLLKYSLMALVSAFTVPVSLMIIREYIGGELSWDDAGYWQAMMYISTMYLMVVTTALSTYYLPRLSEIKEKKELRNELKQGYLLIIPIVLILSLGVYLLKDIVVWLLFTEDFNKMLILFKYQLIGDIFKIAAWLLAYVMLARAMTKVFIITEILFSISLVVLSITLADQFGLIGLSYAYAINYGLYLICMIFIMKKSLY